MALVTGALLAFTAAAAAVARVRDPLVQIDAAQRSGKAITLIGPSGGARWHRWEFGAGTVRDEQTFEVFSVGTGFVELVPRVRHRRFRLVAEFFADDSTHPDSWAGVYIGRVRVKAGGDSLQRMLAAQFHDNRIDRRPAFDGKGDPLSVQDYFGLSTTDAPSQQTGTPVGVVRVPETEEMKQAVNRPWRRLSWKSMTSASRPHSSGRSRAAAGRSARSDPAGGPASPNSQL